MVARPAIRLVVVLVVVVGLGLGALAGCRDGETPTRDVLAGYPATDAGARQLVADLRGPRAPALLRALAPHPPDLAAVFADPAVAARAAAHYARHPLPRAVDRDPRRLALAMYVATTGDLRAATPPAARFPASYRRAAAALRPGLAIYRWVYLAPGAALGQPHDGLVHANGRWRWLPHLGRAAE